MLFVMIQRPITPGFELLDLLGCKAEEEEVFRADFLADFHIGAVEGADGERAIQGELKVGIEGAVCRPVR